MSAGPEWVGLPPPADGGRYIFNPATGAYTVDTDPEDDGGAESEDEPTGPAWTDLPPPASGGEYTFDPETGIYTPV